jgi:serine protease AprX
MKRIARACIFLTLLLPSFMAVAQQRVWVMFTDRGPDAYERLEQFSHSVGKSVAGGERAVHLKTEARQFTVDDIPPYHGWVQALTEAGAVVVTQSRWLNAVSVQADEHTRARIRELPFVASMQPVARYRLPEPRTVAPALPKPMALASYGLDYGSSLPQVEMLRIPEVHDVWIDGSDIIVGMLDNGYRWRLHEAFRNTWVLGEYDVINKDSLTENEPGDPPGQDGHGTLTFSTLGAFKEGQLIGPAFNAAFLLAKTEVNGSETQIEEDYWVEGMEWLDYRGARVVSASLGYLDWDDGTGYSWADGDLDGRTAVTSRAAVEAARRGVLLVTAMGNEGGAAGSLIAPADADSVISVGAVTFQGSVASFSSVGPTSDMRIKPDVVAPGVSVFCATRAGEATYQRANGTSLATPLAAGVAALVISARPELTPMQVLEAMRNTADNRDTPDNRRGWGLVDAWEALLYHGMVISTNPKIFHAGARSVIMVYVLSREAIGPVTLHYEAEGRSGSVSMQLAEPYPGLASRAGRYVADMPPLPDGTTVYFHISAVDQREERTSPFGAPARRHSYVSGEQRTLGAAHLLPTEFALHQSYPNPLYVSQTETATIRYDVPASGAHIRLDLYNALGRRVRTIMDEEKPGGRHVAQVNVAGLATGAYYYSLFSNGMQLFRGMLVLR